MKRPIVILISTFAVLVATGLAFWIHHHRAWMQERRDASHCVHDMIWVQLMKDSYQYEKKLPDGMPISWKEVAAYLVEQEKLQRIKAGSSMTNVSRNYDSYCKQGGKNCYILGKLGEEIRCPYHGTLEEAGKRWDNP